MDKKRRGPGEALAAGDEQTRSFPLQTAQSTNAAVLMLCATVLGTLLLGSRFGATVATCGFVLLLFAALRIEKLSWSNVVVGIDGILVRVHLSSRRSIPYHQILSVEKTRNITEETDSDDRHKRWWIATFIVSIGLVDGTVAELQTWRHIAKKPGDPKLEEDPVGDMLAREIRKRLRSWAEREQHAHEDVLARRGRSVSSWIEALRGLTVGIAGAYRTVILDHDRLWAMLDDPHARPVTRAAAAVALHRFDDGRALERLRIASASVADPEMRRALERIADAADDAALAKALEALHEEDSRSEQPAKEPAKKRSAEQ